MSQRQCVEIYLTVNSKSGQAQENVGSAKRNIPPISPVPLGKVRSRNRLFTPRAPKYLVNLINLDTSCSVSPSLLFKSIRLVIVMAEGTCAGGHSAF